VRKATISFVMSVCMHETINLPLDGFSRSLVLEDFYKICPNNQG